MHDVEWVGPEQSFDVSQRAQIADRGRGADEVWKSEQGDAPFRKIGGYLSVGIVGDAVGKCGGESVFAQAVDTYYCIGG